MGLYDWTNQYSVGVSLMDSHHKKLFDIVNSLHEAAKAGDAPDKLGSIVGELLDYTRYHFGEEERMLEQIGYSSLAEHKQMHQRFISDIEGFQNEVKQGMAVFAAMRVMDTAVDWLREHILKVDTGYTALAKQKGF
jgi:hemerythrin